MKRPQSRSTRSGAAKRPAKLTKITRANVKRAKPAARGVRSLASKKKRFAIGKIALVGKLKIDRSTVARFRSQSKQTKAITLSFLGAFVALLLLVLATIFTPLLAVEKIRITGLSKIPAKQVLKAVEEQIGKPLPLVSEQSVADELSRFTMIESFSLVSELPHTLHIAISERQPICIVDIKGVSYLYDPAGVRLGEASYKDTYPRVSIVGEPKANASFTEAIDVLLALPAELLPRVAQINAKSKDDVTLQLRGYAGQKIIWGDSSQSALKSKVLAALVANQKITDRVTYDVSSPTAPIVVHR